MSEADEVEATLAPFEEGVDCSFVSPEGVLGVLAATGMLEDPAVTVDVAVATASPGTAVHTNRTAGIPLGPSK